MIICNDKKRQDYLNIELKKLLNYFDVMNIKPIDAFIVITILSQMLKDFLEIQEHDLNFKNKKTFVDRLTKEEIDVSYG